MASAATGIIAGINVVRMLKMKEPIIPPKTTMIGGLINYITTAKNELQPMGPNYALLPDLEEKIKGREKRKLKKAEIALKDMKDWAEKLLFQTLNV